MDGISTLLIAIGLAMDAFAVSVTGGATITDDRLKSAFTAALFFGAFQAFMPVIGWLGGLEFSDFAAGFDHWIAFGLLVLIGGKMIHESVTTGPGEQRVANLLNLRLLTLLAVATSIDALAVGVTFAFLDVSIIVPVVVIGIVTFALSFLGVFIGNRFVGFFENRIEIVGGLILIGIGLKILLEDLVF
jgi:putative Mn2+ efflux pump MntP